MAGEQMSATGLGLSFLIASEVPNLFGTLLPDLPSVATFGADGLDRATYNTRWLRRAEAQAAAYCLLLGLGGTILTRTPWPLLVVILMVGWLTWQYETALRQGMRPANPLTDGYHQA